VTLVLNNNEAHNTKSNSSATTVTDSSKRRRSNSNSNSNIHSSKVHNFYGINGIVIESDFGGVTVFDTHNCGYEGSPPKTRYITPKTATTTTTVSSSSLLSNIANSSSGNFHRSEPVLKDSSEKGIYRKSHSFSNGSSRSVKRSSDDRKATSKIAASMNSDDDEDPDYFSKFEYKVTTLKKQKNNSDYDDGNENDNDDGNENGNDDNDDDENHEQQSKLKTRKYLKVVRYKTPPKTP